MSVPLNVQDLETQAREKLPREVFDYYAGAAWDLLTLRENRAAYERLRVYYRVFRDVSRRSTACELFGLTLTAPILVAPTAFHCLAHPDGEVATARGAGAAGALLTLSSLSTRTLEDVAAAATGPLWFQVYINKDRAFTRDLVRRAVTAGYRAIVVTADTPCWGVREADVRNGFHLPAGLEAVNLTASHSRSTTLSHRGSGMAEIMSWMLDPALTWKDVSWLAETAGVPVLVKGICRAEDAQEALRHGASGVIVSNHGGRQLDGADLSNDPPATALPPSVVSGQEPFLIVGAIAGG